MEKVYDQNGYRGTFLAVVALEAVPVVADAKKNHNVLGDVGESFLARLTAERVRHLLALMAEAESSVLDHVGSHWRQLGLTHDAFQAVFVVEELLYRHVLLENHRLIRAVCDVCM